MSEVKTWEERNAERSNGQSFYMTNDMQAEIDELRAKLAESEQDLVNANSCTVYWKNNWRSEKAKLAESEQVKSVVHDSWMRAQNRVIDLEAKLTALEAKPDTEEKRIPLPSGQVMVYDRYPYEYDTSRSLGWRLVFSGGEHNRFLDEFESMFINAALQFAAGAAPTKAWPKEVQPDGSINDVDPADMTAPVQQEPVAWRAWNSQHHCYDYGESGETDSLGRIVEDLYLTKGEV